MMRAVRRLLPTKGSRRLGLAFAGIAVLVTVAGVVEARKAIAWTRHRSTSVSIVETASVLAVALDHFGAIPALSPSWQQLSETCNAPGELMLALAADGLIEDAPCTCDAFGRPLVVRSVARGDAPRRPMTPALAALARSFPCRDSCWTTGIELASLGDDGVLTENRGDFRFGDMAGNVRVAVGTRGIQVESAPDRHSEGLPAWIVHRFEAQLDRSECARR